MTDVQAMARAGSSTPSSPAAQRYDERFPGVEIPDAVKEERQQRDEFYDERRTHRRTGRTRGVLIPDLPPSMKETTK